MGVWEPRSCATPVEQASPGDLMEPAMKETTVWAGDRVGVGRPID